MAPAASGYLLLLVTSLGWSGAWIVARAAAHEVSPLAATVGRFAIAAVALLPAWYLLDRGRDFRPTRREVLLLLAMAGTGIVGYTVLFLNGVRFAPASDGAIVTPALAGVFGMLLAWPALGHRPTGAEAAGAALALSGVILVGWGVLRAEGLGSDRALGDGLFVLAAGAWGVYTVLGRRASDRIPAVTGILAASALGALLFAPVVLAIEGPAVFAGWSALAWANVLYLGVGATAVAFVTFYLGVQRVGVARAAPFFGLVPVFAVLQAAWILGEELTLLHAAGGALVVAGIALPPLLARRASRRAASRLAGPAGPGP
ncbi:MAG TPA: DMT family transporter [Candidatus Thermoplasmatota archaeon]|nr:DMT family transporter [Candidatus Thermoplasmatota archaeon]